MKLLSLLIATAFAPTSTMSAFIMEVSSTVSAYDACNDENDMIKDALFDALMGEVKGFDQVDEAFEDEANNRRELVRSHMDDDIFAAMAKCEPGRCPNDIGFFCWYHCRWAAIGACWYLFPYRCPDVRRRDLGEMKTTSLLDDTIYEETDGAMCTEASIVAESKMRELAGIVESNECRAALLDENKHYSCYNILSVK